MAAPTTTDEFLHILRRSNLLESGRLDGYLAACTEPFENPAALCQKLRSDGLITAFHAEQLLRGKHRGYFLGKYKLLDRIGFGGMGQVFLAEHISMKRRVALKVMPPDRAANEFSRERFLREARAAGQLDHPNLVRAFDIDQDGEVIFLVMEYVDGVSFHDLVARSGPLLPSRAAYYLWQAAFGLNHLHTCGLIHRDIKPANLIVDRQGNVKILDLGLVRSEEDGDDLTRGEGVKILGTADYLAPEQAINCSGVDIRADIYGLGATGYFLMTARPPFEGDKVAQKLIAHQMKKPKYLHEVRRDVPVGLSEIIARMMAKKPEERFQNPNELAAVLAPWAQKVPPPPSEHEIPSLTSTSLGSSGSSGSSSSNRGGSSSVRVTKEPPVGSDVRIKNDSASTNQPGQRPTSETPLPVRLAPTTVTPAPRAAPSQQRTRPSSPSPRTAPPPLLPAAATHGMTPPPSMSMIDEYASHPFEVSEHGRYLAELQAVQPVSRSRRWMAVAIAVTLALLLGTWNVMRIFGATDDPKSSGAPEVNQTGPDIRGAGPDGPPLAASNQPRS